VNLTWIGRTEKRPVQQNDTGAVKQIEAENMRRCYKGRQQAKQKSTSKILYKKSRTASDRQMLSVQHDLCRLGVKPRLELAVELFDQLDATLSIRMVAVEVDEELIEDLSGIMHKISLFEDEIYIDCADLTQGTEASEDSDCKGRHARVDSHM
jgi:hypothetical protein